MAGEACAVLAREPHDYCSIGSAGKGALGPKREARDPLGDRVSLVPGLCIPDGGDGAAPGPLCLEAARSLGRAAGQCGIDALAAVSRSSGRTKRGSDTLMPRYFADIMRINKTHHLLAS